MLSLKIGFTDENEIFNKKEKKTKQTLKKKSNPPSVFLFFGVICDVYVMKHLVYRS